LNKICVKHNVIVVSDEIHSDFVWLESEHTCFGLLNENAVICTAPSKTFNLAGLHIANIIIKNADMRGKFKAVISKNGYSQLNVVGLAACHSAYTRGKRWLLELRAYITGNISATREFLEKRLPLIKLVEPQGTYLLWLDFSEYGLSQKELDRRVTECAGLWLDGGTMFGVEGAGFQRINIACPRSTLMEALNRLDKEFQSHSSV
jgi:cystathionine beta-lyase